eukprot:TRINITY_DN7118_c0_g1_i2.p1 TRINITY_DN7118_c0_g1~~TRINITY_DN7118_c0_g1_i2.p1  ORF type:complete len:240 (+),score=47.27 TRINITY_DN7118_c0_g1_i2:177-896(+)
MNADVISLNETTPADYPSSTVALMAEELGMAYHHAAADFLTNCILSRFPINSHKATTLKVGEREKRSAISIDITVNGARMIAISTHLDHAHEPIRIQQLDLLMKEIPSDVPVIIMGDFNALCRDDYNDDEWEKITSYRRQTRWEEPHTNLHVKMKELGYRDVRQEAASDDTVQTLTVNKKGRYHTGEIQYLHPAATVWANTRIDYIWISSDFPGKVISYKRELDDSSDHYPIVAEIQLS